MECSVDCGNIEAYKSHYGTEREAVPWYLWRVIGTRDIDMPM